MATTLYEPPVTDTPAIGHLTSGASGGAGSIVTTTDQGNFPTPAAGQAFCLVINPNTSGLLDFTGGASGYTERVVITTNASGTFTINGTLAHAHSSGETVAIIMDTTWINTLLASANNLIDVSDAGTSRYNLQLSTLSFVAAATNVNVNISSPGASFDGYSMTTNDELLLFGQSVQSQNGVWVWNGASSALTRPNEFPSGGLIKRGRTVCVANGNTHANHIFSLASTVAGITIDSNIQTWVDTSVFTTSTSALELSLTNITNYPPTTAIKGNTGLDVIQDQTFNYLPPVSTATSGGIGVQGIFTDGTTWWITFTSSILGTLGQLNDQFPVYLTGWLPSGYNIGTDPRAGAGTGVTATIATATTITIPNASTPGTVTQWGTVNCTPIQYTVGGPIGNGPKSIMQLEGTNTFNQSVDTLFGIGPAIQNFMVYVHGTIYSATTTCTNGSNVYSIAGDQRANLSVGLRLHSYATSGVPFASLIKSINYDGTNTNVTVSTLVYNGSAANFTGTTGSYLLEFIPDIVNAEGFVNSPGMYSGVPASFPINNTPVGAAPGQGQGWSLGFWDGPGFFTIGELASISNINICNYWAGGFLGSTGTATGIARIGYLAEDLSGMPEMFTYNYGVVIGEVTTSGIASTNNLLPLVGGVTNVGLLNASTTAIPTGNPYTTVVSGPAPPSITGIVSGTNTFTITFSAAHGLTAGNTFTLSGFTPAAYNNTAANPYWTVTSQVGRTGAGGTYTVTCTYNSPSGFNVGANGFTSGTPGASSVQGTASYLTGYLLVNAGTPTLTVTSTAGFPSSGTLSTPLLQMPITYTGITGTTFTGCSASSNLNSQLVGAAVWSLTNNYYSISSSFVLPSPIVSKMTLVATASVSNNTGALFFQTSMANPFEGQCVDLVNGSAAGNFITITGGGSTHLDLSAPSVVLGPGGVLSLFYDSQLGRWCERGKFSSGNVTNGKRTVATSGSATSVSPNWDTCDVYSFKTTAGGNVTVNAPTASSGTNTPQDNTFIQYRLFNSGSTPGYVWSGFRASATMTLPTTATASTWDYFLFQYNAIDGTWDFVGMVQGV